MSDTRKERVLRKYKKACILWRQDDYSWLNWHPFEVHVIPIHDTEQLIRPVKMFGRFIQFGYYNDGHGIAEFDLKPKWPFKYYNCYTKKCKGFDNLFHTRPERRWNKRQLERYLTIDDLDSTIILRDGKKPETYVD